jgi:hypothetical protein
VHVVPCRASTSPKLKNASRFETISTYILLGNGVSHFTHVGVDVPKSKTTITSTHVFERYVIRCRSKNVYLKDMCLKEIGLCAALNIVFSETYCLELRKL